MEKYYDVDFKFYPHPGAYDLGSQRLTNEIHKYLLNGC